jgi:hypothetical protein
MPPLLSTADGISLRLEPAVNSGGRAFVVDESDADVVVALIAPWMQGPRLHTTTGHIGSSSLALLIAIVNRIAAKTHSPSSHHPNQ